jgi:hypothetical protein
MICNKTNYVLQLQLTPWLFVMGLYILIMNIIVHKTQFSVMHQYNLFSLLFNTPYGGETPEIDGIMCALFNF